jgi:DNA-binding MarR family transcriptional regulator
MPKQTPKQKPKPSQKSVAVHFIDTIAGVRALAHPLRFQLLRILYVEAPLSATQLGKKLNQSPTKLHYHLTEMEKFNLLRVAELKATRNLTEKKYAPVAPWIRIDPKLLRRTAGATDVVHQAIEAMLTRTELDIAELFSPEKQPPIDHMLYLHSGFRLDHDNATKLRSELRELLMKYRAKQVRAGERFAVTVIAYPENKRVQ